jgi:hypothetical protein
MVGHGVKKGDTVKAIKVRYFRREIILLKSPNRPVYKALQALQHL